MVLSKFLAFSQGAKALSSKHLYGFGAYVLDAETGILLGEEGIVGLPPKALATLQVLVEQRGNVLSKQELMDAVWPESFVEEGNLTQNVFLLRKVLGRLPDGTDYIQTLPKRGYRINVPVVEMERTGARGLAQIGSGTSLSATAVRTPKSETQHPTDGPLRVQTIASVQRLELLPPTYLA
jgi:DNA-binding winged helix-turn-helix (wHTH) protein